MNPIAQEQHPEKTTMNASPRLARIPRAIIAVFGGAAAFSASALNWEYSGVNITLDTRLSSSVVIRASGQSPLIVGLANGGAAYSVNADDGDVKYKKGDVTQFTNSITSDLTLTWKNFGFFSRANYLYDPTLDNRNFFDSADFGPGKQYGQDTLDQKNHDVRRHVGHAGKIYDLYAYGNFDLDDSHTLNVKVGKQTINWGESTLILNGLNSILAFDANRARGPGAELSEIIIPSNNVLASVGLVDNVSVEGWYQIRWEHSIADAAGTYFATNDYVGIGGNAGNIDFGRAGENAPAGSDCIGLPPGVTCVPYGGTVPRSGDRRAPNHGQFGGALHWFIPALHDLDLAFYAANYHSRLPLVSGTSASNGNVNASTATYFSEFPKNIHLYGVSANTTLPGGFALQGEYSYKPNQPLQLDDVEINLAQLGAPSQLNPTAGATLGNQYIRGYRRHKVSTVDVSTTRIFGPNKYLGYNQLLLLAESALIYVHDLESPDTLRYEGPGTFLPGDPRTAALLGLPTQHGGFATQTSWGYKVLLRASYNNALAGFINGITLEPTLRFDDDVYGVTPTPLQNFTEASRLLSPSLGIRYLNNLTGEIGYTAYIGGGQGNLVRDRDFYSVNVKYTF